MHPACSRDCWLALPRLNPELAAQLQALHSHTAPLAVGCLGWGGSALCRLLCAFNLCVGGCEWCEGRE